MSPSFKLFGDIIHLWCWYMSAVHKSEGGMRQNKRSSVVFTNSIGVPQLLLVLSPAQVFWISPQGVLQCRAHPSWASQRRDVGLKGTIKTFQTAGRGLCGTWKSHQANRLCLVGMKCLKCCLGPFPCGAQVWNPFSPRIKETRFEREKWKEGWNLFSFFVVVVGTCVNYCQQCKMM